MKEELDLVIDYPSKIAAYLASGQIDIGLIPVAVIPELKEYHIISEYGIGCNGEVASVCLFSEVPLEEIETIMLDYQSKTSVALLKMLLKEHWKVTPALVAGESGFETEIKGTTAGLIIGDRALKQRKDSKYVYDLGIAWKAMTGLPFVFAAWVSNRKLPDSFCQSFNEATKNGLEHIAIIASQNPFPAFDLEDYYRNFIKFRIDSRMHEAITLFLNKLKHTI